MDHEMNKEDYSYPGEYTIHTTDSLVMDDNKQFPHDFKMLPLQCQLPLTNFPLLEWKGEIFSLSFFPSLPLPQEGACQAATRPIHFVAKCRAELGANMPHLLRLRMIYIEYFKLQLALGRALCLRQIFTLNLRASGP
jgi:hypothetical protein